MLPARRRPKKLETDALKRKWPKHRAWVRSHECIVSLSENRTPCSGIMVAAHYRTAANSGAALKPGDWWTVAMCWGHHDEQHKMGQPGFELVYGIDLDKLAEEFAQRSPDQAMRQEMRQEMRRG